MKGLHLFLFVLAANLLIVLPGSARDESSQIMTLAQSELDSLWHGAPFTLSIVKGEKGETEERDAFCIRKGDTLHIESTSASGLLYGAYFLLRSQAMGDGCLCQTFGSVEVIRQQPVFALRLLSEPRGLARIFRRGLLEDYARQNASVGINGIVIAGEADDDPTEPLTRAEELKIEQTLSRFAIHIYRTDSLSQPVITLPADERQQQQLLYLADSWQQLLVTGLSTIPKAIGCVTLSNITLPEEGGWCGHPFAEANWYAFGRLSWDPQLTTHQIAYEWLSKTFHESPLFVRPMIEVMRESSGAGVEEVKRMIETWQQMTRFVDAKRYQQVEESLNDQLLQLLIHQRAASKQ